MTTRPMIATEHANGVVECKCSVFVYIWHSRLLALLPAGYTGELCEACGLWMCRKEKICESVSLDTGIVAPPSQS